MNPLYFDNSLVARPSAKAVFEMTPYLQTLWGSPTAPYQFGQRLLPSIEKGMEAIQRTFQLKEDSIFFSSSGGEAINQVIFGTYVDVSTVEGKTHFLTTAGDEAAAILATSRLERLGCIAKIAPLDQGIATAEKISEQITPRTALVSLSWANGLTGLINPVKEISKICKERGIRFHVDATHLIGKGILSFEASGADFLTMDGAPLHAPLGTGALIVKEGLSISPLILGGGFSIAFLVALGVACQEAHEARDHVCLEGARLRDKFEQGIQKAIPDSIPLFQCQERLPTVSVVAFPGISGEALLYGFNQRQLCASIGGGRFQTLSHLLEVSGIESSLAHAAVSFSLSRETTDEEVDRALTIIEETVKKYRPLSIGVS